jgi:hypothetical protein
MNLGRYRRIVFIPATGGLLTLVMIILATQPGRAAGPWYVTPGGDDGNDCLSPGAACATINGALGKPGFVISDTILVATGTYTGTGAEVVLLDKSATLSGGWDGTFTMQSGTSTVDGEASRRGITVNSGVTAIVQHFTVQNGYSGGDGGGIHNSGTLTLTNSSISGNSADHGSHSGGGIYSIAALTLMSSTVSHNSAMGGGGIQGTGGSSTVIMDSRIYGNTAVSGQGGGIELDFDSGLTMSRSWVVGNAAPGNDAGGIGLDWGGSAYIENSIIAGNTTARTGGGLWFMQGAPYRIVNCHIVGNEAADHGSAITGNSVQVQVTNTLIISNMGNTSIDDQWDSGAVFLLSYCDTYGNSPDGTGNVTITRANCLGTPPEDGLDPLMSGGALPDGVGPAFAAEWLSYDYSLQFVSPAIDAGTPTGAPGTDIEGNPRVDGYPDLGAYEMASTGAFLSPAAQASSGKIGTTVTYTVQLANQTDATDSFTLTIQPGNAWSTTLSLTQTGTLSDGDSLPFTKMGGGCPGLWPGMNPPRL